jgi:hypothetical protein
MSRPAHRRAPWRPNATICKRVICAHRGPYIFATLGLPLSADEHRRVMAALTFLTFLNSQ